MPAQETAALTRAESGELAELESVIERGLETFVEVGNALLTVRDRRLYRQDFDSFEVYCGERWGFTKRRANQLIDAARVIGEVTGSGNHGSQTGLGAIENAVLPKSEREARELAKAPEGERAAAWQESVETAPKDDSGQPQVTAAHVRETVAARNGSPAKPAKPQKVKATPVKPKAAERDAEADEERAAIESDGAPLPATIPPTDDEGHPLPDVPEIRAVFAAREVFDDLMRRLSTIKGEASRIPADGAHHLDIQHFESHVSNARSELKAARPHALCPYCYGTTNTKCEACSGARWVTRSPWKSAPSDFKARMPVVGEKGAA